MNDGILHEPSDPKRWLPERGLVSLLDILGGGSATCDVCGRWQSVSALGEHDARKVLAQSGWTFPAGKDLCPKCSLVNSSAEQK